MKRSPRLVAALLSTALVGSLAAVVSTAAPAGAAPAAVTVSGTYPHAVLYGQTWTVRGTTTSGGHPVTSGTIELYARGSASSGWSLAATDTTPESFAFSARPPRSLQVYIEYVPADSSAYQDWKSAPVNVLVGRFPTGPFLKPHARLITGKVKPAYKHRRVVIYKRRCNSCRWHRYRRVRTSRHSWWKVHIPVKKMQYAAVVPRSPGYVASHSRVLKVKVIRIWRRPTTGVPGTDAGAYVGAAGVSRASARPDTLVRAR